MTEKNSPFRQYTPEEIQKIYAKYEKEFTCEKLIEYIEDTGEKIPARVVLDEIEKMVAASENSVPRCGNGDGIERATCV